MFLQKYGLQKGFLTGRGLPDEHRAARKVLKDYTSGKLLYCHPPPVESTEFQVIEDFLLETQKTYSEMMNFDL